MEKLEQTWKMELNENKCNILRVRRKSKPFSYDYTLHNSILKEEETPKYLGVYINNCHNWSNHINKTVGRAKGTLSFVQWNVQIGSKKVKETAYKSLKWPKLEYASSVWNSHDKILKAFLDIVQRRAARWASNSFGNWSSITAMLDVLQWQALEEQWHKFRLIVMYKILNGFVHVDKSQYTSKNPSRHTRGSHPSKLAIPPTRNIYYLYSSLNRQL